MYQQSFYGFFWNPFLASQISLFFCFFPRARKQKRQPGKSAQENAIEKIHIYFFSKIVKWISQVFFYALFVVSILIEKKKKYKQEILRPEKMFAH